MRGIRHGHKAKVHGVVSWCNSLADHPRVKCREEQGCGDASGHSSKHECVVVLGVLGRTGNYVEHTVGNAGALAAELVGKHTSKGAEDHGRPEAADKEHGNVVLRETI
eukprot:scaffold157111_cov36-Tisochrysis_lutea.AAC.3